MLITLVNNVLYCSDMQVYYLSSCNEDGSDPECEKLGWKKLEDYNPSQKRWSYLASLVEGGGLSEDMDDDTDEMAINDYYASLPFAALFSACKVSDFVSA
jgi:proteasome assembly chaperone 2